MADEATREDTLGATSKAATAFAAKARDLQAMREAVVDAAAVSAGLWLSYLFLLFYLAIAVGSITHRDLFLESPIKLPFLGVELPLIAFFGLAPGLFLVVHAYVLLHFVQLADKLGVFHAELKAQIIDDDVRARLRRQLPSNIFVQLLAGPHEVRAGVMGSMLWLIAHISLVLAPIGLLVLFQLKFLPYHDGLTWWHRLAVLADLALLWVLWPSVARGKVTRIGWRDIRVARYAPIAFVRLLGTPSSPIARGKTRRNAWRLFRRAKVATLALTSLILTSLVVTVVTYPGEWLDDNLPAVRFVPTKWPLWPQPVAAEDRGILDSIAEAWKSIDWKSLHELLFASDPNEITMSFAPRSAGFLSNHLILPNLPVIDYAKFDSEAKLMALPESISLRDRRLERAVLSLANLKNANLRGAHLQRAILLGAQLHGANLDHAQLQGATLDGAQLQGASLIGAQLQDARLANAQLQGANLLSTQLQRAVLEDAQLQGASLAEATLWGAVLNRATLENAFLDDAQLQGASLDGAKLQGASLQRVFVWRADHPGDPALQGTLVVALETGAKYRGGKCDSLKCNWPPKDFVAPQDSRLATAPSDDDEKKMEPWERSNRRALPPDVVLTYANSLIDRLTGIGCESKGAPYVIRQLTVRMQNLFDRLFDRLPPATAMSGQLAKALLDEANCFGARSLSDKDKAELRDIKNRASLPSAPPTAGQPVQ